MYPAAQPAMRLGFNVPPVFSLMYFDGSLVSRPISEIDKPMFRYRKFFILERGDGKARRRLPMDAFQQFRLPVIVEARGDSYRTQGGHVDTFETRFIRHLFGPDGYIVYLIVI